MKLMFCQVCGSIVPPGADYEIKWCSCKRHAVWWRSGDTGLISFHDTKGTNTHAYMLGINNALLLYPDELTTSDDYKRIVDNCPTKYLFHAFKSSIIRVRPGMSNDSQWEVRLPSHDLG